MKLMKSMLMLGLLCASATMSLGCDELKEVIDGEAAPLKENDLPNCSRVITCCNNTLLQSVAPGSVNDVCSGSFVPAANGVIETYQSARDEIQNGLNDDGQTIEELRTATQDTFEPGCRCFLEETIGALGDDQLPLDCESIKDSGALDDGAMCSDATDALLDGAGGTDE